MKVKKKDKKTAKTYRMSQFVIEIIETFANTNSINNTKALAILVCQGYISLTATGKHGNNAND
jgi:hypothetical protein